MSAYNHGVYVRESGTSLIPTLEVPTAVSFVVGTAPVNLVTNPTVNEAVMVTTYEEAVAAFGLAMPVEDANGLKHFDYTLSEFIYGHFQTYANVPVTLVNVLDPARHRKAITTTSVDVTAGIATVAERGILPDTVKLAHVVPGVDGASDQVTEYTKDVDYTLSFDSDGNLVIGILKGNDGAFKVSGVVTITGFKLDPTAVTSADIIGGVDAVTGKNKGLECIGDVYPKYGIVPTLILAPGFSEDVEVALLMSAKALQINGNFNALALIDAPTSGAVIKYSDVPNWKNLNGLSATNQIVLWPNVVQGKTIYHASTHMAGIIARTDYTNDGFPHCSPSNKTANITGLCLSDGAEVILGMEKVNYLNGQGVCSFTNFGGSWRAWGNRTAAYPSSTDPKDTFIPVRRMFHWVGNTIVQTLWQKVDEPGNRRLIDSVKDSLNQWLNSLSKGDQILGGRVEFLEVDNPTTALMDGKYTFRVYLTPPSPAEELVFDLSIDTAYYKNLFSIEG